MTEFLASIPAGTVLFGLVGIFGGLAVILAVTVWKCFVRPLWACVRKARVMRPAVCPREISWAEYRRMNHPRRLL